MKRSDFRVRMNCAALLLLGLPGAVAFAVGMVHFLSGERSALTLTVALYGALVAFICWRQAHAVAAGELPDTSRIAEDPNRPMNRPEALAESSRRATLGST